MVSAKKGFIVYLTMMVTLSSCRKQDIIIASNFHFDATAKEWFTEVKVNDTLNFKSNLGKARIYKVIDINNTPWQVSNCNWLTNICEVYYSLDEKVITYKRLDSLSGPTKIQMYMLPDSVIYKYLSANTVTKVKLYAEFDDYNGKQLSGQNDLGLKFPDAYQPISFVTFTGGTKTYNQVVKFLSNNTKAYYHSGRNSNYTVNEVWCDKKFGFVYFKDIYGQEWSRQN